MKKPFQQAKSILQRLIDNGDEAYFVGGAVRDMLHGRTINDIDIATSSTPEEVMALFPKTIPVGVKHGTVVVRHCHQSYEVTTFRKEADYTDFRRPSSVAFISSLYEDLQRRDFTINAIAMNVNGELIDPFYGEQDITEGVIRTVGEPTERFHEDPLRMMRAVRFVSTLSFEIDRNTYHALEKMASQLQHISVERIAIEFEKLLMGRDTKNAFSLLSDSGLYTYLPGCYDKKISLLRLKTIDFTSLTNVLEHWALFCYFLHIHFDDVYDWLRVWKLPKKQMKDITEMLRTLSMVLERGWNELLLYHSGVELSLSVERLRSVIKNKGFNKHPITATFAKLPIHSRNELMVSGNDLMNWVGQPPGKWVAELLSDIEKVVVHRELKNNKEEIKTWVQKRIHQNERRL